MNLLIPVLLGQRIFMFFNNISQLSTFVMTIVLVVICISYGIFLGKNIKQ